MSNRDVERLLCGKLPKSEALTPLAPMLSAFHDTTWPAPADDAVAAFATAAATNARWGTVTQLTPAPPARSRFLSPALQRSLATGLAGVLFVSGLSGVAVASDDSVPGDLLYGFDRALESIGVGAGGVTERIAEARAMFDQGQIAEAVGHAIRAVDEFDAEPPSAQLLDEIAEMLEDPTFDGRDFGQSVAEIARLHGANDDSPYGPEQPGSGQPGSGQPGPDQPGPGNSDQVFTPPSDNIPGPADDPSAAPSDPPGKSGEAPGKTESSPGKSGGNPASPPARP